MKNSKFEFAKSDGFVAITYMILSGFCFVIMHAAVKYISEEIHPFEIAFFRCAFVIVILSPIIFYQGKSILITKNPKLQIYRIGLNSIALLCFFYGLSKINLAETTALGFTVPIFTTIFSVLFLKEIIRIRRITALIIGFIGTLIVLRPDITIEIGSLMVIISSLLWSICLIIIKRLTITDSVYTISLYAGVGLIPATLFLALPVWTSPTLIHILFFLFISLTGTFAQTLMNSSFKRAEVAMLLPFDFLRLIWSALLSYTIFNETPELTLWIGGTIILSSTCYLAYREMILRKTS